MRFAHSFFMCVGIVLLALTIVMVPALALAEGGGDDEDLAPACTDGNCAGCVNASGSCTKSGLPPCSCYCNNNAICKQ